MPLTVLIKNIFKFSNLLIVEFLLFELTTKPIHWKIWDQFLDGAGIFKMVI